MARKWKNLAPKIKAEKKSVPKDFRLRADSIAVGFTAEPGAPNKIPTFSGLAYSGAEMRPDGWPGLIICDLQGFIIDSQNQPILRQHDAMKIAGHTTSVRIDSNGLHIAGIMSGHEQPHGKEIVELARNGFSWQLSIGADPINTRYLDAGETATVNGRKVVGPITIATKTKLGEISFVPRGADGDTSATVQGSQSKGFKMNKQREALKAMRAAMLAAGYTTHSALKFSDEEIEMLGEFIVIFGVPHVAVAGAVRV